MSGRFINPEAVWAMRAESASHYWNLYTEILHRRATQGRLTPEMRAKIEAEDGVTLETSHEWRLFDGGVAVIDMVGPMVKRGDWMASVSGITSYASLANQFLKCLESDEVKAIAFCVDTPGGEAYGCHELAKLIYESRDIKPLGTYVDGDMASAGLWLGTATSYVCMAPVSEAGSLGVVYGATDTSKMGEKTGIQIVEVVSPQSPYKRIDFTNGKTRTEGLDRIRVRAADVCDKFGEAMAMQRGVSKSRVFRDFGRGNMMISDKAVAAGIADDIGSFDDFITTMASGTLPSKKIAARKPAKTSPSNGQGERNMRLSFLNRGARAQEQDDELDNFKPAVPVEENALDGDEADDNESVAVAPEAMEYIRQLEDVIHANGLNVDGVASACVAPAILAQERSGFMAIARRKITPAQSARTEKLFAAAQEGLLTPSMLQGYFAKMSDHGSLARLDTRGLRRADLLKGDAAPAGQSVPADADAEQAGYANGTSPASEPLNADEAIIAQAKEEGRAAAERLNGKNR